MIKTRFTIVFIVTMIHWGRVANTSCRYVLHNQKTYWNGRLSQQTTRQRYFFSPYWTILASFPIFPNISVNALYELGFWNVVLQHLQTMFLWVIRRDLFVLIFRFIIGSWLCYRYFAFFCIICGFTNLSLFSTFFTSWRSHIFTIGKGAHIWWHISQTRLVFWKNTTNPFFKWIKHWILRSLHSAS